MEQTFTAPAGRYTGPVFATITAPTATVRVTVDAAAKAATVTVSTRDADTSPAADAVRAARIHQEGQDLSVHVPAVQDPAGVSFASGSGSSVSYVSGHGRVIVGGVVQSFGAVQVSSGVEVHVTLPAGSGVVGRTVSGDVTLAGAVSLADVETTSGDVTVTEAVRLTAVSVSGDVRAGSITDRLDAESTSGDVRVTDYAGRACRVRTMSGDVTVNATREARGALTVHAVSGDVTLRGTAALAVEARTVSGDLRRS